MNNRNISTTDTISRFALYNYLYKEHNKNLRRKYNVKTLNDKISSIISIQQEYMFLIVIAHFNIHNQSLPKKSNNYLDYKSIYNPNYNNGIITYNIKDLPNILLSMLDIYIDKLIDKTKKYREKDEINLSVSDPSKLLERNISKLKSFSSFIPNTLKKPIINVDIKYQVNMLGEKYKILILKSSNVNKKTTKLKCWWCKESFTTKPVGIPIDYIQHSNKTYSFHCDQNCCSWECVLAIIDDNDKYLPQYKNKYYKNSRTYINWIFEFLGINDINKANHWSELNSFSENGLSINEFRENNYKIKFTNDIIYNSTARLYNIN